MNATNVEFDLEMNTLFDEEMRKEGNMDEQGQWKKEQCMGCNREVDIRDTFFLMRVPYCYDCVVKYLKR